jgi:Na+-transporting methylmalonyl-CoA/oxaloacetate decarboxylase gamma subunit
MDMKQDFEKLIGAAVVSLWPDLPRDLQEAIFEAAAPQDDKLRETLAIYLHDHHTRTAHKEKNG